jgi:alpha-L-fucosidase
MKVNSESIYGTTASPFKKLAWGKCTQKPDKLYLHVFDWPADGKLTVPLASAVKRAYLLADKANALTVQRSAQAQIVQLPGAAPTPHAAVVVLEIAGPAKVLEPRFAQSPDGILTLKAADAELIGKTIRLETKADGIPNIGFWTDAHDSVQWPATISKTGWYQIEAEYACDPASAGSDCVLVIGDKQATATVAATGGWDDFATDTVGEIQIDRPGPVNVIVKATSKPGMGVVNLRAITLRPY